MDQEWATQQLDDFVAAIDRIEELERVGRLIAEDERQTLRLENDMQENENIARSAEPIAQIVMEAVEPGLSQYENLQEWGRWSWEPARRAALRARGLVSRGAEAKEKVRSDAPALTADFMHEWVWSAARPMWEANSYPAAVHHAAQSVNARLQNKLGRYNESEGKLCAEAFSLDSPKQGRSRLRFHGDRSSSTWRSLQEGAGWFGRGCFSAMRNPAAHNYEHPLTAQEALEELAALSRLARWVEQREVESHDEGPESR